MEKCCVEVIERFRLAQIESGKSELTAKTYAHALTKFNEWLMDNGGDIDKLTRHDIQSYITHLDTAGRSASTISKTFAALCVFARYIQRHDIIENIRVPEFSKSRNIAPKSLEPKEKNRLLREVERTGNLRDIAMVYVLLYSGIRVSELCALNRNDVEKGERHGHLRIRHGKGNKGRKARFPAEARYHLGRYLDTRNDKNEAVFLSNEKKRISVRTVQYMLSKHGVHPHQLRHTFCRELIKSGFDIAIVAELAGHADINVTRRYSNPTEAELDDAIERAFS